jgi:hypothetical protein
MTHSCERDNPEGELFLGQTVATTALRLPNSEMWLIPVRQRLNSLATLGSSFA